MTEATDAVAWLKKPFTLSKRGTCCSSTASAGRARIAVVEKRIVAVNCGVVKVDDDQGKLLCASLPT
jgi:hypothetical protein